MLLMVTTRVIVRTAVALLVTVTKISLFGLMAQHESSTLSDTRTIIPETNFVLFYIMIIGINTLVVPASITFVKQVKLCHHLSGRCSCRIIKSVTKMKQEAYRYMYMSVAHFHFP